MSNAKKCDRCGKLYEEYNGIRLKGQGNGYQYLYLGGNNIVSKLFDLCEDCMTEVIDWIKAGGDKE